MAPLPAYHERSEECWDVAICCSFSPFDIFKFSFLSGCPASPWVAAILFSRLRPWLSLFESSLLLADCAGEQREKVIATYEGRSALMTQAELSAPLTMSLDAKSAVQRSHQRVAINAWATCRRFVASAWR